jgi:hypothetical protein
MTKEQTSQIEEGNQLIADFHNPEWRDGVIYETVEDPSYSQIIGGREVGRNVNESDLEYHTSWDWLMPVIRKINDYLNNKQGWCQGDTIKVGIVYGLWEIDIEKTWQHTVEFIKWFNQTQKNNG